MTTIIYSSHLLHAFNHLATLLTYCLWTSNFLLKLYVKFLPINICGGRLNSHSTGGTVVITAYTTHMYILALTRVCRLVCTHTRISTKHKIKHWRLKNQISVCINPHRIQQQQQHAAVEPNVLCPFRCKTLRRIKI